MEYKLILGNSIMSIIYYTYGMSNHTQYNLSKGSNTNENNADLQLGDL